MYKRILFVLGFTAVLTLIVAHQPPKEKGQCAENMHYVFCGTGCPKTCNDVTKQGEICKQPCRSGCSCDEGYVFENEDYKHCILHSDCKMDCQNNAKFMHCGTACPLNCDNLSNPPKVCTEQCVKGCACEEGYVYESATSKNCIPKNECKTACQANAEFTECGTNCPLTCDNLNNSLRICSKQCVKGCACKEGYVYESATSKNCIPQNECKTACQANAQFEECATACPLNCDNLNNPLRICTKQCAKGCVCKEGYVYESATSKNCIPQNECKPTCQANAEFKKCGTNCPLSCDNLNNPRRICTKQCVKGCTCKEGFVYESARSKNCIPQNECNKACQANAEFSECGTACPLTCDNLSNSLKICTAQCVKGCACKKGYVYESATSKNCIPQNECKTACQANAEYKECGTTCPLTCDNLNNPRRICTKQCAKGCACKEGYVYESATSKNCIPQNECKTACQANAEFKECGTACPLTCDNLDNSLNICTALCVKGCACKEGYVYESATSQNCIPQNECKTACQANAEFKECGTNCPLTCDNLNNPRRICTKKCVKGCACKEGYVYESAASKNCIPQNECKTACQVNAEFSECGTACPLTCDNLSNALKICTAQCVKGCACKEGYVYETATSKNCIPQNECKTACQANAEFKECGTNCPLSCDNLNNSLRICSNLCVKGCACKEGYVYETATSKKCIPQNECKTACQANAEFKECGTNCPLTCDNLNNPLRICTKQCAKGCVCKEGYVYESATSKNCIHQNECKTVCRANAQFTECATACPLTCDNLNNPRQICTKQCAKGCACKEGYVYESATSKNCIPQNECKTACQANAEFKECGTTCPLTCDNLNNPQRICTKKCVKGCDCKKGYVYESAISKNCIPTTECKTTCQENAEFKECGTACPRTCDNLDNSLNICTALCVKGCACKEGYVYESATSQNCIPQNECKTACQANAEFKECGTNCPLTCDNLNNPRGICTKQCAKGCVCKEGYVYESATSQNCIPQNECKTACQANAEFKECGTNCPLTCDNLNNPRRICTKQCAKGCVCKEGYVYESATSKNCIPQNECKTTCQANAEFKECGTACPLTCDNLSNALKICTAQCVKGCACKEGYVYESATSKKCIPQTECKTTCQANAEFKECGTTCPLTCDNLNNPRRICTKQCAKGCACKEGYVYESAASKNCIPQNECKTACQANAEFKECGTNCPLSCDNLNNSLRICSKLCVKGCACKEGYVYETATSKNCISQNECKTVCRANAQFTECATACPLTCDNLNNPQRICTKKCVKGCACKEGYVYESAIFKNCIPTTECKTACQENAEFKECGTYCPLTCDNLNNPRRICTKQCAKGCACKEGYVYESATSKNCIPQNECKTACQANAEFKVCGTTCPLTCDNLNNPQRICTKKCVKGCACKEGYVYESARSKNCIPKNECKITCQANAEFSECGTACPLTCDNLSNSLKICTAQCVKGCACKEGYVYESATSKNCIPQNECKTACQANAEFTECGTTCPLTCDNVSHPLRICTKQCAKGCACKEGYVYESATSKNCILQNECKTACQANAEFKECGTNCPITCENLNNPRRICTKQCVKGCTCKEGFVYETARSKNCIPQNECKKTCQRNSEFTECGTACPLNCDNLSNPPKVCTEQCVKGCACKEGYVYESARSRNCIPKNECKKTCQANAEYRKCGTSCPKTCDNLQLHRGCIQQCVSGCFCKDGYVLENSNSDNCILPTTCKTQCTANAHYQECGTACPKTCADVVSPTKRYCIKQCESGCFCNEGYVLENGFSGNCVSERVCRSCPANSYFSTCGSACPLNCQNHKHPLQMCPALCVTQCVCNEGFIFKSGKSGPCVRSTEC